MSLFFQNLRLASRLFTRRRGLVVPLVIVLAVGIGGTTTMFTLAYSILLRPLPFPHPERLVAFGAPYPPDGQDPIEWWKQAAAFEALAQWWVGGVNLSTSGESQRVVAARVTAEFFSVLEVSPQFGRPFHPGDFSEGQSRVALISDGLWKRQFGGAPNVIGQTIRTNSVVREIVGVMPPGFDFPGRSHIWFPHHRKALVGDELGQDVEADWPFQLRWQFVGRSREEMSFDQTGAAVRALFARMRQTYGDRVGIGVNVTSLRERMVEESRPLLLLLLAATGSLLLLACANAANLLLVRGIERQKEIAVRVCLGAGPGGILSLLATEGLVLGAVSGGLGILLAFAGVWGIQAFGPRNIPRLAEASVDLTVLVFCATVAVCTGILMALAPAMQVLRRDMTEALKQEGTRTSSGVRARVRNVLVTAEIAIALVLLIGAGLAMQSLIHLLNVDFGFRPQNVLAMSFHLPNTRYASVEQVSQFNEQVLTGISALPGTEAAGMVHFLPLGTPGFYLGLDFGNKRWGMARANSVSGDYFRAMGIPLLSGRTFTERDSEKAPKVIILSEMLARDFSGYESPIGRTLLISSEDGPREVVGVVADVKQYDLRKETYPEFYLPYRQPSEGRLRREVTLVVRTPVDPNRAFLMLRERIAVVDKDLPPFEVRTMEGVIAASTATPRMTGFLLSSFGAVALALAMLGVYGLLAYSVAVRAREIGIRMALGAQRGNIVRLIVNQGAVPIAVGTLLGLGASWALSRLMERLLFGVHPTDPGTFATSAVLLILAALLACLIPAIRASRTDPGVALRYE